MLLLVLGVQMASIGLIGEIVIFLTSRKEPPEIAEVTPEPGGTQPDRAQDAR